MSVVSGDRQPGGPKDGIHIRSFACGCPVVPAAFVLKIILPPTEWSWQSAEN